jgi:hypothetical protein
MWGCGRVTDRGFAELANCAGLQVLNARDTAITDTSIVAISQNYRGLRELRLGRKYENNDHFLTDASLHALSLRCKDLQSLHIYNCRDMTESALITLTQSCKGLRELKLIECRAPSDALILAVAQNCTGIEKLRMTACKGVSTAAFTALAQTYRALRCVLLRGPSVRISKAAVDALAQVSPHCRYNADQWSRFLGEDG